ncbi:hypothetical protein JWG41_01475 [Leptospira sp. 201903075]|uniref:hypothetical protein n=1 Tax=Leptospira chreensis TaxID=2810035 RepID=UPI001962F793|nr:hypothetical protein [Leptospira chreensis]MBM9589099.1 hypothetical protein [Leptospira chreensis]
MNRIFLPFLVLSFLFACAKPKAENLCDADDSLFLPNILYRLILEDKSSQCGYRIFPKFPACQLEYEETHLAENWPAVKAEMETQFALGSSGIESLFQYRPETVGSVTGNGSTDFQGALNAPNGEIYFLPYDSTMFLSVNPIAKTFVNAGVAPGGVASIGGSLGPAGKIFLSPHLSSDFLTIDTTNGNQQKVVATQTMGSAAYNGAIYAPNGKIYFVPSSQTIIRYYDTIKDTIGTVATPTSGGFSSAVLTPQGKIYFIPFTSTTMYILDTKDDSVTTHPHVFVLAGGLGYIASVLTPNGRIYMIPFNNLPVIYLDTATGNIETAGNIPTVGGNNSMFNGAVLAPNGKIYPVPFEYPNFISIDTKDNSITTLFANPGGTTAYRGGAVGPDGNIYLAPHGADRFDLIDTKSIGRFCPSLRLSPYWNKL